MVKYDGVDDGDCGVSKSLSKCQFWQEEVCFLELTRHSPRYSERAYQRTHYLARLRLWLSMMGLILVVVVVVASGSKNYQKSKNLKRLEKSAKAIGSEEPSFWTSDTRLAFTKISSSHTHDGGLLVIVEAFKKWSCKHKVLVLAYYCNLWRFRDMKSSSSRHVRWT